VGVYRVVYEIDDSQLEVTVLNVGVSGPGVVRSALERLGPDEDLVAVAETVKRTAFKVTRMGELVGREAARRLGTTFGIVDVSLAPTPAVGDSVSDILPSSIRNTFAVDSRTMARRPMVQPTAKEPERTTHFASISR